MAQNDSKKYIKSVAAFNGGGAMRTAQNTPTQYASRQAQYMAGRTAVFDANRAYLATDYVNADVQGLIPDDFYAWTNTNIRLADISHRPTANSTKKTDDYKQVLFPESGVDYFPIGAKIKAMGSVWICVNPSNMSTAQNTAIVARCNASYNSYDFYGNVITETILVERNAMLGNDTENAQNLVLMDGYFNITCQLNENTAKLQENSRIILGKKPYHITGVTDFIQEFSGDRESCHLLTFTARVEELTESDDIEKDFVANGKELSFEVKIQTPENINVGDTAQVRAVFVKNGDFIWQPPTAYVENETGMLYVEYPDNYEQGQFVLCGNSLIFQQGSTPLSAEFTTENGVLKTTLEYPIAWDWLSTNTKVATINANGVVTAIAAGSAQIVATLRQNPAVSAMAELIVKEKRLEQYVEFISVSPNSITQYESVIVQARYFENGDMTKTPLKWSFGGAKAEDFSVVFAEDGLSVEITCLSPSDENLEITASYGEQSATMNIELLGY